MGNEKWATEVTRVDQRVVQNGSEKSRTEVDLPLLNFGRELREAVEPFRNLKYSLILNGPPSGIHGATWKKQVRRAVEEFVKLNTLGSHDFGGGSITASDSGHCWLVVSTGAPNGTSAPGGHMMSDISANNREMISHALGDKVQKLRSVSGYDRVGLVLLNMYPLAGSPDEVGIALRNVIRGSSEFSVLDFVFFVEGDVLHLIYEKPTSPLSKSVG
ncbi:MAG: hypothetical protein RIC93_01175 [Alphaproteobacteria bacterium]